MARSSFAQTNFLGGEWSPLAQGRSDDAKYTTAMNLCLNAMPVEEGAWVRRSCTTFLFPTRARKYAKLIPFDGSETCSFVMEFTDDHMRMLTQSSLVFDNSAFTINSYSGGTFTLSGSPGWSVGDYLMIAFPDSTSSSFPYPVAQEAGLRNRLVTVASNTTTSLTLADDLGNAFDTTNWPANTLVACQVMRVKDFSSPYAGFNQLKALRGIQAENQAIILSSGIAPHSCRVTTDGTLSTDPVFAFDVLKFIDGPYLDPSGDTCTVSAYTGTITVTASTTTPFKSTDVGRHIRLFSQPAAWAAGTAYSAGNVVTGPDGVSWWQAIASNTGVTPGTLTTSSGVATVVWVPAPTAGSWAWGKIASYISSSSVTVALDTSIANMALNSANGTTMTLFRLGVFSDTTGYPTCGTYHEGRLWLAGCIANRFDASASNGLEIVLSGGSTVGQVTFSPTDPNGNVLDNSGISEVLNAKKLVQIQWMEPNNEQLVCGTLAGEFVIKASSLEDPITPTSIQAHQVTAYGSANIEPVAAGMATIFVQKYGRRVIEYLADGFTGKFTGRHLNKDAKHLTPSGVSLLAYQEETAPVLWALTNSGALIGATYRRLSRFVTEDPTLNAWHWHAHGGSRIFTSMAVCPGKNGLLDRLFLVTDDPQPATTGGLTGSPPLDNYYIEVMQPLFDTADTILQGQFCDQMPGVGPGTSLTDCGGGNAFAFGTTGGLSGGDSVSAPDMSTVQPFPGLPTSTGAAATEPLGSADFVGMGPAALLDGNTALYVLPKPNADTTSMSLSVWVGSADLLGMTAGSLVSAPALSQTEANTASRIISAILSGRPDSDAALRLEVATSGNGVSGGSPPHPASIPLDFTPYVGNPWAHVMVSAKSDGAGNIVVTMAVNDTVVYTNQSSSVSPGSGSVGNNNNMWPFSTSVDQQKDFGPAVWTIGGAYVCRPVYDTNAKVSPGPPLQEAIKAAQYADILALIKKGARTVNLYSPVFGGIKSLVLSEFATAQDAIKALTFTRNLQTQTVTVTQSGGGATNLPTGDSTSGYQGFRGNINELWIATGTFIDWTSSTNRYKFHSKDPTTNIFYPVSLGKNGQTPTGSAPWVYCAGSSKYFNVNRATGKSLTVSGLVLDSSLNWPPGT